MNTDLPPRTPPTILLVEDDFHLAAMLSVALESKGYKVLPFCEGSEALAAYRQRAQEIDLLLTDIMLPGINGVDLIRSLKKINPALKVIASSGYLTEPLEEDLKALGVNIMLKKPYNAITLIATVHEALFGKPELNG